MNRFILACAAALAITAAAPAAATAVVSPGAQTFTDGAQCTANFVFRDGEGTYVGQAAHCSGTGGATETDGCDSGSLPIGTPVEVAGASQTGTMVYNSWLTMQGRNESNADVCTYNDFALVKLSAADAANVDPSVPRLGGPTGLAEPPSNTGATVYTYGNSSLRGGVTQLSPKQGTVVQSQGNGWSRDVYTATPGIPGDSGSGFMDSTGRAIGVLSTVQLAPLAGSNGVGNLNRELDYARQFGGFGGLALVPGTRPFNPNNVAAIAGL
jgi:Trypsin-like peptidase domain